MLKKHVIREFNKIIIQNHIRHSIMIEVIVDGG